MGKILDQAVTSPDKGETWDFQCPGVQGSPCGDVMGSGQPFHSTGWPTKKAAQARGQQHFVEHKSGEPMPELDQFRREQGLVVNDDGTVSVEDL